MPCHIAYWEQNSNDKKGKWFAQNENSLTGTVTAEDIETPRANQIFYFLFFSYLLLSFLFSSFSYWTRPHREKGAVCHNSEQQIVRNEHIAQPGLS